MPYFWLLPDANRNRNYRVSGDYIFCSITAFLAFLACIGGIVFLLIGSHDKKVTKNLDANIDFKKLSEPCTIVGYKYIKSKQKSKGEFEKECTDVFEFYFIAPRDKDDTFSTYEPFTEFVSIHNGEVRDGRCKSSPTVIPSFHIGDLAECWRPTSVPSEWYRCGNDECIKIFSPALDIVQAKSIANERHMWGTIVTIVSLIVLALARLDIYLDSRTSEQGNVQVERRSYPDDSYLGAISRQRRVDQREGVNARNLHPLRGGVNIQEAMCDERYELILSHLIHKKVLSKPRNNAENQKKNNLDDLLLPHQTELSLRLSSCRGTKDNSLKLSSWRKSKRDNVGEKLIDKKNNILVETLRSIRSTLNISIRTDNHDGSTTLYSPKTCPICCEDYVKGDDIAWSKNEECCHAFHTDCIVPWLMEHDECPMCRSDYICIESG